MMNRLSSRLGLGLAAGVLVVSSLVGCKGVVSSGGGDGGDGGAGGSTGTTTPSDTLTTICDPGACPTPAIAMTHSQEAAATGQDPNGGVLTDTQFLFWGGGEQAPACGLPYGGDGCGGFNVSMEIPTPSLVPGVLLLGDPTVQTFIQETFGEGGNSCAASGSIDFGAGQIEILSVSDTEVVFTATGIPIDSLANHDMNGTFTASRCQ
jgi:hypothetical protein